MSDDKTPRGVKIADSHTSEDLRRGQVVIVTARWILVLAGLLLAIWNPGPVSRLRIQILVVLLLAVANFYLHAQIMMRRPAIDSVVYGASIADLSVITILVLMQGGFESTLYIFYFPAILAFSVAFPSALTLIFVGGVVLILGWISAFTGGLNEGNFQILITRILMITAVGFSGNLYFRIERGRREAALEAQDRLLAQVQQTNAPSAAST